MHVPVAMTVVFSLILFSADFRKDALGTFDIVGKLSGFLGVLTGFFIAALAAVATFGKTEMDDPMPGDPPLRLEHKVNRETYFENLSRRRFLSLLFGYLSFVSLSLYIVGYMYLVIDKYLLDGVGNTTKAVVFCVFWVVYMFFVSNIISNTYLGLFYLSDRIHRPNRTITWGNQGEPE